MAKFKRRTPRQRYDASHVRFYAWMMNSPAYRSLSALGRALLVELYALYNGLNNGDLFLSVRDAALRLNVSKTTVAPVFKEVESRGFIRARQRGSFAWKERHATSWILTEFSFAGQPPTKDFMRWTPGPEIQKPVRKAGQTVQAFGLKKAQRKEDCAICPDVRTDLADFRAGRSAPPDTDSLPYRGSVEGAESRAQPEGERSAANAPRPLGKIASGIVERAKASGHMAGVTRSRNRKGSVERTGIVVGVPCNDP